MNRLFLIVFFVFNLVLTAQTNNPLKSIDSLKTLLSKRQSIDQRTSIYYALFENYGAVQKDSSFHYAKSLAAIAKQLNNDTVKAHANYALGKSIFQLREYENSLPYLLKSAKQYEALKIENDFAKALNALAMAEAYTGTADGLSRALKHQWQSIDILSQTKDPYLMAWGYMLITEVYYYKDSYKLSYEYANKSDSLFQLSNKKFGLAYVKILLGDVFMQMGRPKRAENFFLDAINEAKKINDIGSKIAGKIDLAKLYVRTGQTAKPVKILLNEAVEEAYLFNDKALQVMGYYWLGMYHVQKKELEKAKSYLKKAILFADSMTYFSMGGVEAKIDLSRIFLMEQSFMEAAHFANEVIERSEGVGTKFYIKEAYEILYQIYKTTGDHNKALYYHEQFKLYNDSIYSINANAKFTEADILHQAEKDKTALEFKKKEIKILSEKAKNNRLKKGLYAGGMFMALALSSLLYFGFRQRLKRNHIEREKQEAIFKQEIEHKKKELASQTLHLVQKSQFITELKDSLESLKNSPEKIKVEFKRIVMLLKKQNASDKDWEVFKSYFSEVHKDFDQKLKAITGKVTDKELRLAAYVKMGLNNNEIANILNVLPSSIHTSKYRLKKKLHLDKETDLTSFLNTL